MRSDYATMPPVLTERWSIREDMREARSDTREELILSSFVTIDSSIDRNRKNRRTYLCRARSTRSGLRYDVGDWEFAS